MGLFVWSPSHAHAFAPNLHSFFKMPFLRPHVSSSVMLVTWTKYPFARGVSDCR